jgi:hypothetical protein
MSRAHINGLFLAFLSTLILFGDGRVYGMAAPCADCRNATEANPPFRSCNEEGSRQLHGCLVYDLASVSLKRFPVRQRWVTPRQCVARHSVAVVNGAGPACRCLRSGDSAAVPEQAPLRGVVLLI